MMLIGNDASGLLSEIMIMITLLLGGEYNRRTLESWGLTASIEVPQTPSEVIGLQSRREDDGNQEQILVYNPYVRSHGFLKG